MKFNRIVTSLGLAEFVVLLVLHVVLLHTLAARSCVARVFAMGGHVPLSTKALVGLFFLVRILAVVCLPGVVLSRAGMVLLDRFWPRQVEDTAGQATSPSAQGAQTD